VELVLAAFVAVLVGLLVAIAIVWQSR